MAKELASTEESFNAKYDLDSSLSDLEAYGNAQTIDESLAQAITVLTETKRKKILSELENREIFLCSILYAQSNEFDDDLLKDFLDKFLTLRVSKERSGRKEIVDIAKSSLTRAMQTKGLLKRLISRGGSI